MKKVVLAVVPARGGSKGIKKKNLERIGDLPLVAHAVHHGKSAKNVTHVVMTSDDPQIREAAERGDAIVFDRPDEFAHDATWQEVDRLLIWVVEEFESKFCLQVDLIVLLYPTAPLRPVGKIEEAVEMVLNDQFDSVLSVYHDTRYLWKTTEDGITPINYDPQNRMPRQKETWNQWAENKAIYVMTRELLFETGCRLGRRIGKVEMQKWESIDIDQEVDLALARALFETNALK